MSPAYKVLCKEKRPKICRTKLQAYNFSCLYRTLEYNDVRIVGAADGEEVRLGTSLLTECPALDVVIDDMKASREVLRRNMSERRFIEQHLAGKISPLTAEETPKGEDPASFTADQVILPLLACLGFSKSNIVRSKGAQGPDMTINLKGAAIAVVVKPLDYEMYEKDSVQILSHISDEEGDGKCMAGIFTDGAHWLLGLKVDGRPVSSGLIDLRGLLRSMYSKDIDESEYAKHAGTWKFFTELYSSDTLLLSVRTIEDRFRKQQSIQVGSD